MKNILLVLGLVASTSLTWLSVSPAKASSSELSFDQNQPENWTILQDYTGTNEDSEQEEIDTTKK